VPLPLGTCSVSDAVTDIALAYPASAFGSCIERGDGDAASDVEAGGGGGPVALAVADDAPTGAVDGVGDRARARFGVLEALAVDRSGTVFVAHGRYLRAVSRRETRARRGGRAGGATPARSW
jgi:hypothetical protein